MNNIQIRNYQPGDFQQTTQEHVWPRLNKADLIATARKT
ncbi:DNA polymerase IV [Shigella sonnei]|nr:DNA polymerase IV [Shigella sonnei]